MVTNRWPGWPTAAAAALALLGTAVGRSRADLIYDNGTPPPVAVGGAQFTGNIHADNFFLPAPAVVTDVRFWDYELPGSYSGSVFWAIYASAGPVPGAPLASGETVLVTRTFEAQAPPPFGQQFRDDLSIGPVALAAGTYWLGLHNGPLNLTTEPPQFLWVLLPTVDGHAFDPAPFQGNWSHVGNELSFQLFGSSASPGIPEPGTLALLGVGLIGLLGYGRRGRGTAAAS
jgi:hypothetical protein